MSFQVDCIVNYPDAKEVPAPTVKNLSRANIHALLDKLLDDELDLTSFVMTVVKHY